jgi:hypothetical protein
VHGLHGPLLLLLLLQVLNILLVHLLLLLANVTRLARRRWYDAWPAHHTLFLGVMFL